jgi:hypothetical protein
MEHDLVCHDIGSMGSMGSVSSMALGISSSKCSMIFSFVGPKVYSIRPSQADTVTPQKYLPKPGFQRKTDPLQKIIPTLLLKQLILKFSVSIDFYKRNLFYIESFYSWYNHNQVEVVEQKLKIKNLYESPIQKFKFFYF